MSPQDHRLRLQSALSKDEALTAAIAAADSLVKAMKLVADPIEKAQLKVECNELIEVATRIKQAEAWKPSAHAALTTQTSSKTEEIGQWAANTAVKSAQPPASGEPSAQRTVSASESPSPHIDPTNASSTFSNNVLIQSKDSAGSGDSFQRSSSTAVDSLVKDGNNSGAQVQVRTQHRPCSMPRSCDK
jgi:calpain-7